jgi:hypothetical protein
MSFPILRAAGLGYSAAVFAIVLLVCTIACWVAEPTIRTFEEAVWYSFQVVTTIGFGDLMAETFVGRVSSIILSMFSIFFLAVITGSVASFVAERIRMQAGDSMLEFGDKFEHLNELSPEELEDLSKQVREFRKNLNRFL